MKKIILYLMNEKGKKSLEAICEIFSIDIVEYVISSRDKNVKNDFYYEIKSLCNKNNIRFLDKDEQYTIREESFQIAIGWRWLIKNNKNLIVFHDSLLPKYRGFAPLVNSLINKEKNLGVTALMANKEFDRGDIIAQKTVKVNYPIKINEAILKVSILYQNLITEIINNIQNNTLKYIPQKESEATYSVWRDEEDYHINWNQSASDILRFINAVGYPYNGAYSFIGDKKVIILEASLYKDLVIENRDVGKVLFLKEELPVVICKKGLIIIEKTIDINGDIIKLKKFRTRFK